jgi:NADH dehydrogenase
MTLRETMALTQRIVGRHRPMVALPQNLSHAIAGLTEFASAATLGKFPAALTMTRDQAALLDVDNVVSAAATAEERTLNGLGVTPQGIEAIAPSFLWRFRKSGQYEPSRFA